jgi:Phytanoyl-CoA dioxygenase (PhyH)
MSLDVRTRRFSEIRALERDEIVDTVLPEAVVAHGTLAARGLNYYELPPLGLDVGGRTVNLVTAGDTLRLRPGLAGSGVVAVLDTDALSDLVQDVVSTMGLTMTSRVKIVQGDITDWIHWEPVLRALFDGRKVYEPGDVTFVDLSEDPLDLTRSFTPEDDHAEMANFLEQAGFLLLRHVFSEEEMAALGTDIDYWMDRASPDDGESWWATDSSGANHAVRVLSFHEKSELVGQLVTDDRFRLIGALTDDGHVAGGSAEGLVKPLGIVRGLSDLPWHKDCGQGGHSYTCNGLTCGISVTSADRTSGALGVVPGSHRANTTASGRDGCRDLEALILETLPGDVTVHCSDTLHRAHPPKERSRKVVYSGFGLPRARDDERRDISSARTARAALSDVQSRIEAADNEASPRRYRAGLGR